MRRTHASPYAGERERPVLVKDLRSLRVLLVQPDNSDGTALRSHLMRIGCHVEESWPPPAEYPENIDIVFVMVDRVIESELSFAWQADNPPAVLIAVIDYENPLSIDRLLRMRADTVIGLPIRPFGILTNLLVTVNNHRREQQLRSRCALLQARVESCRTIERAKLAMMLTNNRSEQEAYAKLRNMAMARRTTVDTISEELLNALDWRDGDAQIFLSECDDAGCPSD